MMIDHSQVTAIPRETILRSEIMVRTVIWEAMVVPARPARGPTKKEMTMMRMATKDQEQRDTTEERDQAIVAESREFQAWMTIRTLTTLKKTSLLTINNLMVPRREEESAIPMVPLEATTLVMSSTRTTEGRSPPLPKNSNLSQLATKALPSIKPCSYNSKILRISNLIEFNLDYNRIRLE